jgi:DNA-binding transcriptional MerR regulator/methylmalonyl-CoA mutase cobalamin-binding subunit
MKAVVRRTGLTPHVIRVWERRYGAVRPRRTATNRRSYTDEEVRRLILLKKVVDAGHSIGQVASLPGEELAELLEDNSAPEGRHGETMMGAPGDSTAAGLLEGSLKAAQALDSRMLESVLRRGVLALSRPVLLQHLILPLLRAVGEGWHEGDLRVAHEHMASGVIRTLLGELLLNSAASPSAPDAVFATPAGQLHELGALAAAVMAASDGWKVTYLGADLPAEEIAAAALHNRSRAVCLSITYPADDAALASELTRLRGYLPKNVGLAVGGAAAGSYRSTLGAIGAASLEDMGSLRPFLASLRESEA